MDKFTLQACSVLDDYDRNFAGNTLVEVTGKALCSVSVPLGGYADFNNRVLTQYQCNLPGPSASSFSENNKTQILWIQQDQFFFLFDCDHDSPPSAVLEKIRHSAYVTDQSDSFVMLRIDGPNSREALARICPLDLNEKSFPVETVKTASMEHIRVVIVRESEDAFLLMASRSFANSFLHAVEVSLRNVT